MTGDQTREAYDEIAAQFAVNNAAMPEELVSVADRFLQLVGAGARILDLGCGAGRDVAWLEARGAAVVGGDLSLGMLTEALRLARGSLVQMDMLHPPLIRVEFSTKGNSSTRACPSGGETCAECI